MSDIYDELSLGSLRLRTNAPVLAICGWSGAGKTTLIEDLIPRLAARGLDVVVVKHDAHSLDVDRPGKDTDRFFRAGAKSVYAFDERQLFQRTSAGVSHFDSPTPISEADVVLVEGLKRSSIDKIWLHHPDRSEMTEPEHHTLAILDPGAERTDLAEEKIVEWLDARWRLREQWIGVLFGGGSRRMGSPKHLLRLGNRTMIETVVGRLRGACPNLALLGERPLPEDLARDARLIPDAPDVQGPLAGILAAVRWNPSATWTFVACDMPALDAGFIDWLREQRRPGAWCVLPELPDNDRIEPLAAVYEPQIFPFLEHLGRNSTYTLQSLQNHGKAVVMRPPPRLTPCLLNANTPEDWQTITGSIPSPGA